MLNRLVELSLAQRMLVLVATLGLAVAGVVAWLGLPIDAYPDIAPTQVKLILKAPGMTPEEVESRETLPYMDEDEYFGRESISSGTVYAWHWEDTQSPRLFLADAPVSGVELSVIAKCDPYRDVDLNTDMSGWRVGLRPLLVQELSAQIARQNGYDYSGMQAKADRLKSSYRLSIRIPPPVRRDSSIPGCSRSTVNARQYASGEWL